MGVSGVYGDIMLLAAQLAIAILAGAHKVIVHMDMGKCILPVMKFLL